MTDMEQQLQCFTNKNIEGAVHDRADSDDREPSEPKAQMKFKRRTRILLAKV